MTVRQLRGRPLYFRRTCSPWLHPVRIVSEEGGSLFISNWPATPHGVTTKKAAATNISSIKVILTHRPIQRVPKPSYLEVKLAKSHELLPSRSYRPRVLFLLLTEMWEIQLKMRDSRLTQRQCWRFSYFGLWRRIVGCPVSDDFGGPYCLHDQLIALLLDCLSADIKELRSTETSGTAHRTAWRHVLEFSKDENKWRTKIG